VAEKINEDPETNQILRIIFIPNYNASKEHIVVPAADFNEQISLPGEEACTTISEKFILNGALIIGSKDSTNNHIAKEVGLESIFLFGPDYEQTNRIRSLSKEEKAKLICPEFKDVVTQIENGEFGQCHPIILEIFHSICEGNDTFLQGIDFKSYI